MVIVSFVLVMDIDFLFFVNFLSLFQVDIINFKIVSNQIVYVVLVFEIGEGDNILFIKEDFLIDRNIQFFYINVCLKC